jgi:hypothetical protein
MGIIKSRIIAESGLLLQEYSGEIEKKDMLDYLAELYSSPEYLKVSIIHSDFTKANAILSVKDLSEIAYFILRHAPKVQHVKNSILVSKPLTTAYSLIYSTIMKAMPLYECKIFSTSKEAANFISHDADDLQELMKTAFTDQL